MARGIEHSTFISQGTSLMTDLLNIDCGPADVLGLGIKSVRLADVPATEVAWLWPGRIALGKVTLLAGDPGIGKSLLTLDIASRVSRGESWPDSTLLAPREDRSLAEREKYSPASVVLLSAEDDVGDTIRPRLEAHSADCSRIHVIRAIAARDAQNSYCRLFDLSRDLEHLEMLLDRLPDCRLIVIDPVSAYLGRCIENTNSEVRGLLGPLVALAAERNLAVLAVTHLRKEDGAAMYRTMGSMAFIAAARAAWIVCKDPNDDRRRLFLPVKNNLANEARGLAYTIEPLGANGAPVVSWSADAIETSADSAIQRSPRPKGRPNDERLEAAEWLTNFLADGPQPASEVREAAEAHGFAYGTLRKAFRDLGGTASRLEGATGWRWQLAEYDLTVPNGEARV
jgi:putative DNA primase/helicase